MVELPTLPFGGLIGLGMVIGSFFSKSRKDLLFWGGLGLWGYHFIVNFSIFTTANPEYGQLLNEVITNKDGKYFSFPSKVIRYHDIAPQNMRMNSYAFDRVGIPK